MSQQNTWIFLNQICRWIWIPCPLLWREPLLLNLPLQYSPYSMVYDPIAFMACKLIIVAWLIAYGATMKSRAPMEQLPHGEAAWHALVSRLLTKNLYQVTPSYRFCYKIFFLEIFGCSNEKSTTGWWNSVPSSKPEEVVLEEARITRSQFMPKVGAYGEHGREGKRRATRKN